MGDARSTPYAMCYMPVFIPAELATSIAPVIPPPAQSSAAHAAQNVVPPPPPPRPSNTDNVETFFSDSSSETNSVTAAVAQVNDAVAEVHASIPDILPAYAMLREVLGDDDMLEDAGPDLEDLRIFSRIGVAPKQARDVCSVCREPIEGGQIRDVRPQ